MALLSRDDQIDEFVHAHVHVCAFHECADRHKIEKKDLYQAYKGFCGEHGYEQPKRQKVKAFYRKMKALEHVQPLLTRNGRAGNFLEGITLVDKIRNGTSKTC